MGLVNGRAEIDHYNAEQKKRTEVDNLRANEIAETQIYRILGLSKQP